MAVSEGFEPSCRFHDHQYVWQKITESNRPRVSEGTPFQDA